MRNKIVNYILGNHVLSAILIVGLAWIAIQIRDVLIALFISYIITAAITPYVEFLRKNKVPKHLAVIIPYIAAVVVFISIIIILVPFFITQLGLLFSHFPSYLNQDIQLLGNKINSSQLNSIAVSEFENLGRNAFAVTTLVFGGVISAISVFAISFYLLLYRETITKSFVTLFPSNYQGKIEKTTIQIGDKLGSWVRGQLVLSFFIGTLTWIILTILGVDFALPLAVLAGLLEIVPTIGPIISAIPAVIVALNTSLLLAGIVVIAYVFIQLTENNILVPRIMQRAVGLNPIVIIIGIIVGSKLLGISGALLAIPFISLLVVAYKNLE